MSTPKGINDLPNELLLKICRYNSIHDADIIVTNPLAPLSLSSQLLAVNKSFRDAGRSIPYGENNYIFESFRDLKTFTATIGAQAAANITKLTFSNNANAVYSASDIEPFPKLQNICIWLPSVDIYPIQFFPVPSVHLPATVVVTNNPLPTRLQSGEYIPDEYSPLFPPSVPFFATKIIQLVRDRQLRIEMMTQHRRACQLKIPHHGWLQTRTDFYIVVPVEKGTGIKSSRIKRNHDMMYLESEYEHNPATRGF